MFQSSDFELSRRWGVFYSVIGYMTTATAGLGTYLNPYVALNASDGTSVEVFPTLLVSIALYNVVWNAGLNLIYVSKQIKVATAEAVDS